MSWQIVLILLVAVPVVLFSLYLIWYFNTRHHAIAAKQAQTQPVLRAPDDSSNG